VPPTQADFVPTPPTRAEETRPLPRPREAVTEQSLMGDAAGLRARWQRVQASFVDDPRSAVGDAANLVDQTAQALVVALRQRQRQLRGMWDRDAAPEDSAPEGSVPEGSVPDGSVPEGGIANGGVTADAGLDTEQLRQLMQRYRSLFNQLCRP
jgi:hypothetical protein